MPPPPFPSPLYLPTLKLNTIPLFFHLACQHYTLIQGIPQLAITSPMVPCGGGTQTDDSGPCSPLYETSSLMQEAIFVFKVIMDGGEYSK